LPSPSQAEPTPELPAPSTGALASIAGRQVLVALRFLIAMTIVLGCNCSH